MGSGIATERVQGICDEAQQPLLPRENQAEVTQFSAAIGYGPRSTPMHASRLPARRHGQARQSNCRGRLGGGALSGVGKGTEEKTSLRAVGPAGDCGGKSGTLKADAEAVHFVRRPVGDLSLLQHGPDDRAGAGDLRPHRPFRAAALGGRWRCNQPDGHAARLRES